MEIKLLDDEDIKRLKEKEIARLPSDANLAAFRDGLNHAISEYFQEEAHTRRFDKKIIRKLWGLAFKVVSGGMERLDDLMRTYNNLPPAARHQLLLNKTHPLPAAEEFRDDPQRAAKRLCQSLSRGGYMKQGRNRPTGRQSRPTFEPRLQLPRAKPGRPAADAASRLVMWIAIAWLDATGSLPSLTAHHDKRGPFVRLVKAVLDHIGTPQARSIDPVELINKYGASVKRLRKKEKPCH